MISQDVVFSDIHMLARYLISKQEELSPVRPHKTLYFLFAYYGALYKKQRLDESFPDFQDSPPFLFDSHFEAWKYGPVVREVYDACKNGEYDNEQKIEEAISEISHIPVLKDFLDDMISQIYSVSDFGLIDRSCQDECWKQAKENDGKLMCHEEIVKEYIERYL